MLNQRSSFIAKEESIQLTRRLRRNRKSAAIRQLVQETFLLPSHFVAPLFIKEGIRQKEVIESMPGVFRFSMDEALKECLELFKLGVRAINLFPVIPEGKKDPKGLEAIRGGNLLHQTIQAIKTELPDMCVMADVALDPFTTHGHDGVIDQEGNILNDETLVILAEMAALAADAGVDVIAPSDMMDGRVGYIRKALDAQGFQDVNLLSYAAKYASCFYAPFRDALNSAPKFGDKKTYQMNPANSREAILECLQDEWEGADMLMIKPALAYLDIIAKLRERTELPIAAYQVSGEYAMIMAASERGWLDGERALMESLLSIKRAGADFILTYGAKQAAKFLSSNHGLSF